MRSTSTAATIPRSGTSSWNGRTIPTFPRRRSRSSSARWTRRPCSRASLAALRQGRGSSTPSSTRASTSSSPLTCRRIGRIPSPSTPGSRTRSPRIGMPPTTTGTSTSLPSTIGRGRTLTIMPRASARSAPRSAGSGTRRAGYGRSSTPPRDSGRSPPRRAFPNSSTSAASSSIRAWTRRCFRASPGSRAI